MIPHVVHTSVLYRFKNCLLTSWSDEDASTKRQLLRCALMRSRIATLHVILVSPRESKNTGEFTEVPTSLLQRLIQLSYS
jgi:hypothetical protein